MRTAVRTVLLAVLVALLGVWARPAVAEGPEFGPVEIRCGGQAAPVPSAAVCGFSVVAAEGGPQLALTQRPATCIASVHPREDIELAVTIRGIEGPLTVTAEAALAAPGEAEVGLVIEPAGDGAAERAEPGNIRLSTGSRQLRATVTAAAAGVILYLKTIGVSGQPAVRWRKVQLRWGDRAVDVPFTQGAFSQERCPPLVLPELRPAIEEAMTEWDWRMQDGIDTERVPQSYSEAIRQTLARGDKLLDDLRQSGADCRAAAVQWQQLRRECEVLRASAVPGLLNAPHGPIPRVLDISGQQVMPPSGVWEDLWRRLHQARRRVVLGNRLVPRGPLVFIKQAPSMFSHQLTQYYGSCARPGGGVFVLENPGKSMRCRRLTNLPEGSYQHPEVSYDGRRVLFSYCRCDTVPKDREERLDRFYHLYEMACDGSSLRQLTDGPYDDFSPRYLPEGKILFLSTRRGGFHRCGRGPCAVYTLSVCNADGSQPRPISFHETHEWDPAVLSDGRIIYTRWDYVDRHAVHYQQLWSIRPDGSDPAIFYGNNTFNPVGIWEARPVPGSARVMATAAAHHAMTAGSIILVDRAAGVDGPQPIVRLTPDALFPESEAPVVQGQRGRWHAPVGVTGPLTTPPEAARWPGHCYRSPHPLSEKYFFAAYSFDPLIGEPTWNRANLFGIYLVDCFGNKELLYRDLNIASLWPTPLEPRPRPPRLPSALDAEAKGEGAFLLQNVYASWPALPPQKIARVRIVQVLPKTTPHINAPTVGLANGSPGKQVLGTVPVEADGSAYFRAPAGIPLAFQALDERGQAVQIMRSLTYLQPGETAACVGCHEPRTAAPPASMRPAHALRRPPSTIAPGPDGSNPLSYPILVQPVLDRKCVSCHNKDKPEGKVVLTGEPQGRYTVSYNALAPRVPHSAWGGKPGDFRQVNSEPATLPEFFGARGCELMKKLLQGHEQVELSREEIERLATWMDANALFYGTFDPEDQTRQQRGQRIAGPKLQ